MHVCMYVCMYVCIYVCILVDTAPAAYSNVLRTSCVLRTQSCMHTHTHTYYTNARTGLVNLHVTHSRDQRPDSGACLGGVTRVSSPCRPRRGLLVTATWGSEPLVGTYSRAYVCMCQCIYVCVSGCTCARICVPVRMCMYACTCAYVYVCVYVF